MKKLRVLLVDDEIMIREGFKRLFDWEAHGCEVVGEAADGMEALTQIDTLCPDIVIMDINIPMPMFLAIERLSSLPKAKATIGGTIDQAIPLSLDRAASITHNVHRRYFLLPSHTRYEYTANIPQRCEYVWLSASQLNIVPQTHGEI